MTRKRNVLLRIEDLELGEPETKKLRVHVTLRGLSAAVVEALAEMSERSRAQIVRELVQDAVRERKVYEDLS